MLATGSVFAFNCTPSAANPPPSSYVFERDGVNITEGVNGSIFSVTFLKRDDTGNYTCTAMNVVRSVTIATYLLVTGKKHFHFPLHFIYIYISSIYLMPIIYTHVHDSAQRANIKKKTIAKIPSVTD